MTSKMFLKRFKEVWDAKGGLAALDLADQRFVEGAFSEEERQSIAARISDLALHDLFGGNPLFEENPARSVPVLRRMLDFAEGHFGKQHYSVADVSNAFGRMLMAERRDAEAEEHLLRALAVNEAVNGHRFYSTYSTHELGNLVGRYEAAKRLDLAAQLLERQVAILGAKAANPRAARALLYLGKAYAQQGRLGDAEANLREDAFPEEVVPQNQILSVMPSIRRLSAFCNKIDADRPFTALQRIRPVAEMLWGEPR